MSVFLRVLGFLAVVVAGSFSVVLVMILALKFGFIESLPNDAQLGHFKQVYLGGGAMVWLAASLIGVTSFFTRNAVMRLTAFLMPVMAPLLYAIVMLFYFSAQ